MCYYLKGIPKVASGLYSEREELLHTLFRTELYRKLQEALKAAYDEAKAGIEENLTKQTAFMQSIPHDGATQW